MSQYFGLIEAALVFGGMWLFYWSQMRALRRMRAEDEEKARQAAEDAKKNADDANS